MKHPNARPRRLAWVAIVLALVASLVAAQPGAAKAAKKKTTAKKKATTTTARKAVTGIVVTPGSGSGNAKDVDTKGILQYGVSLDITGGGAHFDPNQSA